MRFNTLLSLICTAVPLTLATVTPTLTTRDESISLNPPVSVVQEHTVSDHVDTRRWTNARRLAEGLPLNPPKRRRGAAARAVPSSTPHQTLEGYLLVSKREDGTALGYVASNYNTFGELGRTEADKSLALKVKFDATSAAVGASDIEIVGASYPFFGAISGFSNSNDNFATGSFNYAFLGATAHTDPGSSAVVAENSFTAATAIAKGVESSIFTYDPATMKFAAQWINTDGNSPATSIAYSASESALILTGDEGAFVNTFGAVEWVTLTFVPADTVDPL
ncbi:hypothetical protein BDQ17DRAFT_1350810 [Cyathus striatus]|nr:hypothetical protein BDQ17DRAFT_1350810 [Cyathus striatus]